MINIKKELKKLGVSQAALARRANVTKQSIFSKIDTIQSNLEYLQDLLLEENVVIRIGFFKADSGNEFNLK